MSKSQSCNNMSASKSQPASPTLPETSHFSNVKVVQNEGLPSNALAIFNEVIANEQQQVPPLRIPTLRYPKYNWCIIFRTSKGSSKGDEKKYFLRMKNRENKFVQSFGSLFPYTPLGWVEYALLLNTPATTPFPTTSEQIIIQARNKKQFEKKNWHLEWMSESQGPAYVARAGWFTILQSLEKTPDTEGLKLCIEGADGFTTLNQNLVTLDAIFSTKDMLLAFAINQPAWLATAKTKGHLPSIFKFGGESYIMVTLKELVYCISSGQGSPLIQWLVELGDKGVSGREMTGMNIGGTQDGTI